MASSPTAGAAGASLVSIQGGFAYYVSSQAASAANGLAAHSEARTSWAEAQQQLRHSSSYSRVSRSKA